ncbi:hypothetical protein AAHE18_20G117100 [Arachis hypogaea]
MIVISTIMLKKPSSNKGMLMVVVSSEASMSPHPAPPISSAKAITKGMVPENEVVNGSSNEMLFVMQVKMNRPMYRFECSNLTEPERKKKQQQKLNTSNK